MDTPNISLDLGGLAQALSAPTAGTDEIRKRWSKEELAPGVELKDYTTRTPNEDHTHVLVIEHFEHIEKIPQPPTPEEIEQRKEEQKMILKVLAGIGATIVGVFAVVAVSDSRKPKSRPVAP